MTQCSLVRCRSIAKFNAPIAPPAMAHTLSVAGTQQLVDDLQEALNRYWNGVYDISSRNPQGNYGLAFSVVRWFPGDAGPDITVSEVPDPGVPCNQPNSLGILGCAEIGGTRIWVRENLGVVQRERVLAHEYGHILGFNEAYTLLPGGNAQDLECHVFDIMSLDKIGTAADPAHAAVLRDKY